MLMPGSPHAAGHGNRGRLWRPSRGEHSCKRPVIAGAEASPGGAAETVMGPQVEPSVWPSPFCAGCALPHRRYCLPQRSSSVRACVTQSKSGCSGARAETETCGTAA